MQNMKKQLIDGVYFIYNVQKNGYDAFLSNGCCLVNVGFCGYTEKSHLEKFANFVKKQNEYKYYPVNE